VTSTTALVRSPSSTTTTPDLIGSIKQLVSRLAETRPNGERLFYSPSTNTFGVADANGAPKTLFRPTDGIDYWRDQ
jgi:hypothetical protein